MKEAVSNERAQARWREKGPEAEASGPRGPSVRVGS